RCGRPGPDQPPTPEIARTALDLSPFAPPLSSPLDVERRLVEIDLLGRLADLVASGQSLEEIAGVVVDLLHGRAGHDLALVLERREGRLVPAAARGEGRSISAGSPSRRACRVARSRRRGR
ncbi:hypothetical protein LDC_1613, partial [sediment metagenome]